MTSPAAERRDIVVSVNGEDRTVAEGTTLDDLVAAVTTAGAGIAVALNDEVVPRGAWHTHTLNEPDRIEILTAVQGG